MSGNTDACRVLCSSKICQQLPLQLVTHVLTLAVQLLHASSLWQRQPRTLVLRHVCMLFSRLAVAAVQADASGSNGMAARACVRQVLAVAVQLGAEGVLQQLLGWIPVHKQPLLSHTYLFILQAMVLRQADFNPDIMRMLCGLQLSCCCTQDPALRPVSVQKLYDLLAQALELGTEQQGPDDVLDILQMLVAWEPQLPAAAAAKAAKGSRAGRSCVVSAFASGLSDYAVDGLGDFVQGSTAEAEQLHQVLHDLLMAVRGF
jgi:hypothetical protein